MELTARQQEFADAALRIASREGMTAVTFRNVAAEANMSLGAVQKAFGSKDLIVQAMLQRVRDNASSPALGEPGRPDLHTWLIGLSMTILPVDDDSRARVLQAHALSERAAFDPVIAQATAASDAELLGNIALLVGRAISEGEIQPVDPAGAARQWLMSIQGLTTQLLYAPRPVDEVRVDVERAVAHALVP